MPQLSSTWPALAWGSRIFQSSWLGRWMSGFKKPPKDEKTEKPVAAKKRKTEKKEKKDGQANRAKKWGV